MTEAIIDTDILSFYFKGDERVVVRFGEYLKEFDQVNISIVTYYEITAGLKFKKAERQLQDFEALLTTITLSTYLKNRPNYRATSMLT